jgi:iron complex transport system substrate-binding protein
MYPERIVTLAAEIPAIIYELGALHRVVGISGYTTAPEEALSLPKVSGFRSASIGRIMRQKPDLAILTSGVQQELAVKLGQAGVTILHLNPHRLADLFDTVSLLGNVLGESARAEQLNEKLHKTFAQIKEAGEKFPWHPRVYFEEWMDPPICGTGWVSDLIEIAGGIDVFREKSVEGRTASLRQVTASEIAMANADIVLASWCGKPFDLEIFGERAGSAMISAVKTNAVYELDGNILQCGPGLVEAAHAVHDILREHVASFPSPQAR